MHSLKLLDDQWAVVRYEPTGEYRSMATVMFYRLSFDTAMKLVNFLNGGGAQFSAEQTKAIEMCKT